MHSIMSARLWERSYKRAGPFFEFIARTLLAQKILEVNCLNRHLPVSGFYVLHRSILQ